MTFITAARIFAAAIFILGASAAAYTGLTTQNFVNTARHTKGTIVAIHDGTADIAVQSTNGPSIQITQPTPPHAMQGDAVDLLTKSSSDGQIDTRLNSDHILWSPMWTWIETAFAALLAAIYGQQLLTDPLSVIGFKSWRLGKPK